MRRFSILIIFSFLYVLTACEAPAVIDQELTPVEQKKLINSIIRYAARMPDKANLENRLDSLWNEHYAQQAEVHRIDRYYKDEQTGKEFMLVSRIAPSLKLKRVGIGIEARFEQGKLSYYKEVFRTWKMEEPDLKKKGHLLFEKMVRAEDLTRYYPENSGREEFIEFPDANTHFDTLSRSWISSLNQVKDMLNR
jgi:hypothetical protein